MFTEEDHLVGRSDNVSDLYKELKESVLSIFSGVQIRSKKKYIAFIRKRNFADIVVWKSSLSIYLNMKKGTLEDHRNMARDVSHVDHWGNGDYEIKIAKPSDMGYALSLIRQSYDKN